MRVLVLGAAGMAGHLVYDQLQRNTSFTVESTVHTGLGGYQLDASDETAVIQFFKQHQYDCIVNCIGSLVQASENYPLQATRINSIFPRLLEQIFLETSTRIIHISTDCVFSGMEGRYTEDSPRDGLDIYAKTKAIGEIHNTKDVTLRTSIIGPNKKVDGSGLFHWFMKQESTVNGYRNHLWGGITTLELSKVILYCIQNPVNGLVHVTNGEAISKLELLRHFNHLWRNDSVEIIETDDIVPINKTLLCTRKDFTYSVPPYEAMLSEMHEYMKENYRIYKAIYAR